MYFRDRWSINLDKSVVRLKKRVRCYKLFALYGVASFMYLAEELFISRLGANSFSQEICPATDTPRHLCTAYRGLFPVSKVVGA